jgi:hypothetical protein
MKEIQSRKTGNIQYVTDDEWNRMGELGLQRRFTTRDIEPIQRLTPVPKLDIEKVIIKKTKPKIHD